MYTFFTIGGFIFVLAFSIFTNYIYDIFPINKITSFIKPDNDKGIWNKISITVLPIIIWSLIELPILGTNENYIIAVLFNIIISCAIIYEIRFSCKIIFNLENNYTNIISIIVASSVGQLVAFMILKMKPLFNFNTWYSIGGIIFLIFIFIMFRYFPPKTDFFRDKDN